ncbi:MAG: TerB family tellurite resistance protein [Hyphomicrobiales bacterium]
MWHKLKIIFAAHGETQGADVPDEAALRLATAALLVHASLIDGDEHAAEQEHMFGLLQDRFELTEEQTRKLIARARAHDADAVDLYGFTRVLTEQLDPEGRAQVVEMLWEIVLSDKVLDDYEANLVWRVAELLRISTRERVVLRKKVAARLGLDE